MANVITLTTDFGTADGFVGAMKGVILSLAPQATVIDITHGIPPHDIRAGTFALETALPFFPQNAIHVVVVDPGVGSERAAILVETERGRFVAPDNGVLTSVVPNDSSARALLTGPTQLLAAAGERDLPRARCLCAVSGAPREGCPARLCLEPPVPKWCAFPWPQPHQCAQMKLEVK